ncbi:MAG: SH3 domain-containing protein [Gemmatimonadales bacterium]
MDEERRTGRAMMVSARFRYLGAVIAVATAVGLVGCTGELEEKLAAAEAKLSKVQGELRQKTKELAASEENLAQAGDLQTVSSELAAAKAEFAELEPVLKRLRAEVSQQEELLAGSRVLYRTVTRSRVRREPSTDAAEVAVVPEGSLVQVMEVVEGGTWYKVGGMGYIFHELLEPASE